MGLPVLLGGISTAGAAVGTAIGGVKQAVGAIGGLLGRGGGDPGPDKPPVDRLFGAALSDGPHSRAHAELKCWAGINDDDTQRYGLDAYYRDKAASGYSSGCSSRPSTEAYAKAKLIELEARWAAGGIVARAGFGVVKAGDAIAPHSASGAVSDWIQQQLGTVPWWGVVAVIGGVGYLLIRAARRR